jgi:hypothetical protein
MEEIYRKLPIFGPHGGYPTFVEAKYSKIL